MEGVSHRLPSSIFHPADARRLGGSAWRAQSVVNRCVRRARRSHIGPAARGGDRPRGRPDNLRGRRTGDRRGKAPSGPHAGRLRGVKRRAILSPPRLKLLSRIGVGVILIAFLSKSARTCSPMRRHTNALTGLFFLIALTKGIPDLSSTVPYALLAAALIAGAASWYIGRLARSVDRMARKT
jgi:hypothetical protein